MAMEKEKSGAMLTSEELSVFCDQIALMLESGMTLRDGIDMLAENYSADRAHVVLNEVQKNPGALDMAQEVVTKPDAFAGAFDQTGNVRDHEASVAVDLREA